MGIIIDFLIENFIYVIFVVILLILALIGYIVDNSKSKKMDSALKQALSANKDAPIAKSMNSGIKLGESVNQTPTNGNVNVNANHNVKPVNSADEVLKL